MQEKTIVIERPDGPMRVFIAAPDGPASHPGIVMYHNVAGLGDHMRDMARFVAARGYVCAVPDLYYRLGTLTFNADSKDPYWPRVRELISKMVHESGRLMDDTGVLLEHLRGDPLVAQGPMGTIGFCGGGRQCLVAAGAFPGEIAATASFFPVYLIDYADTYSPHRRIKDMRGGVYIAFAEHDHTLTLDEAYAFQDILKARCSAEWKAEVHPGTEHAFAFPNRPSYHQQASEKAWSEIFPMLRRHLG